MNNSCFVYLDPKDIDGTENHIGHSSCRRFVVYILAADTLLDYFGARSGFLITTLVIPETGLIIGEISLMRAKLVIWKVSLVTLNPRLIIGEISLIALKTLIVLKTLIILRTLIVL